MRVGEQRWRLVVTCKGIWGGGRKANKRKCGKEFQALACARRRVSWRFHGPIIAKHHRVH